jgi:hypothetical protein
MESSRQYNESLDIFKKQGVLLQSMAIYENIVQGMGRSEIICPLDLGLENMKTETCSSIQMLWDERKDPISRSA